MGTYFYILAGAALVLALLGVWEQLNHRKNLAKIPVRIHVNGTRGKSSVTRLIAAGLRAGGVVTCAKTTGTLPRMIMPDGREYPVFRPGRVNIIEQVRIVAVTAAAKAKVLVVECMALQPHLQWLTEAKIVRATHGVITNARADHLDVMGPSVTDVALALCGIIPKKGPIYTAERTYLNVIQACATDRHSPLTAVTDADIAAVTPADLARFSYIEHAENVALALKVCADLGVAKATALAGMWRAEPDPGVMTSHEILFYGRKLVFINGFAANDPESTRKIWHIACQKYPHIKRRVALFNCRADRPDRSLQLGGECPAWLKEEPLVLMGSGTYLFARAAMAQGVDTGRIHFADDQSVEQTFEDIVGLCGPEALIVGMGNIGGQGLEMVQFFKNRSILKEIS